MKTTLLLLTILLTSCSSGGHLLPFRNKCFYIKPIVAETIKKGNHYSLKLTNGKIIYGVPKDVLLDSLFVCDYRGGYYYLKN